MPSFRRLAVLLAASCCAVLIGAPAPARAASTCAAASYSITGLQSNVFYIDTATDYLGSYVGYSVTNSTGTDHSTLWLRLENFSGGQVRPATGAATTSPVPLPAIAGGASASRYAYLKAAAATTSATTFDAVLYDGRPGSGGTEVCRATQTITSVQDVIKASANKVTSASGPSSATLGGTFALTVNGSTGTIGAGIASDPGVIRFSPAVAASWPSDSFRLIGVTHTVPLGGLPTPDLLSRSGMSGPDQSYTVTYTFRVVGPTTTATPIVPVQNIASGTQVKHTDPGSFSSLAPIPIVTSTATVGVAAGGGAPYTAGAPVPLSITLNNSGSGAISIDEVRATLPAGWAPIAGSWELDGSPIGDPYDAGSGSYRLTGPYAVGATSTRTITFDATAGGGGGTFSAVGALAGGQVDSTTDPSDDRPAGTTLNVLGAPDAVDDSASVASGVARDIDVLANDDTTGATPTLSVTSGPANGTATVVDGQIRYTPAGGFAGTDTFTYELATAGGTDTATVTVTVAAQPAAPAPGARTTTGVGTAEQHTTPSIPAGGAIALLDGDGQPATVVTVADEGTYALDPATGDITFDPVLGFQGQATPVTFQLSDAYGQTGTATYTPTVTPPVAPTASARTSTGVATTPQSTAATIPAGGTITLLDANGHATTTVTVAGQGTYTLDPATGIITFTAVFGYHGSPVPVSYRVADPYGQIATATYAPTVTPPAAPTAAPVSSTGTGTTPQQPLFAPLVPAGGSLRLVAAGGTTVLSVTVAGEGRYTVDPLTGMLTFEPVLGFHGTATGVTYVITDAYGQTATATYRPAVTPPAVPAAAPATTSGTVTQPQGTQLPVPPGGSIHFVDADGTLTDHLTIEGVGSFTLTPSGAVTFTPAAGFVGTAPAVRYRLTDAYGQSTDGTYVAEVAQVAGEVAGSAPAPPARCVSRRIVHMHWVVDRLRPRAITVTVNGKVVARRPGSARDALVDLRGMSDPVVKVVVGARVRGHKSLRSVRRYHTCVGRRIGPPLPTLRLR